MKENFITQQRVHLNKKQREKVWKLYVLARGKFGTKKATYEKIASIMGCGWQNVYNVIRAELDLREHKIFE